MGDLAQTAAGGDRLKTLEVLRGTLAAAIEDVVELKELPALSRQLTQVLAEIESLKPTEKVGDSVDEIAERRASRRSRTA